MSNTIYINTTAKPSISESGVLIVDNINGNEYETISVGGLLKLGAYSITSDKIEDKLIDTTKIKFKERYKFVIAERGRGIAVIKNIVITDDTFDYYNTARPTVTEARTALQS